MTWRDRYQTDPAAAAFPMLDDAELEALGEDIKRNGLKVPIVFWRAGDEQFLLIDGRNRLEAMERADIELPLDRFGLPDKYRGACVCKVSSRKDPLPLIIALNVHRRHLSKQQQADLIVAAHQALKETRQVGEVSKGGRGKVNQVKAAAIASAEAMPDGPSKRTVERAFERRPTIRTHRNHYEQGRGARRSARRFSTITRSLQPCRAPLRAPGASISRSCRRHAVDIAAELEAVVDGLQRIADQPEAERLKKRARQT